ncbi:MAG: DNA-deoxyinosine glycosylase [Bacilli bacterium]|nr:DNA-deoxyinosine glycosylase [Bacilli bacterium]
MKIKHVTHESIPPFINKDSKILILGSLPSVKSREYGFYYAHPQNRFFKLLAEVFNENEPKTTIERKEFLIKHRIGLYDVIYECDICGSSDSSIKNVKAINIKQLLEDYPNIKVIMTTGKKAKELYDRYLFRQCNIEAISLPSSSPANASIQMDKLIDAYQIIKTIY